MKDWAELRNMLSRTTAGPWYKCDDGKQVFTIKSAFDLVAENVISEDADFIVAAHNEMAMMLWLINELETITDKAQVVVRKTKYEDKPWTIWIDVLEQALAAHDAATKEAK